MNEQPARFESQPADFKELAFRWKLLTEQRNEQLVKRTGPLQPPIGLDEIISITRADLDLLLSFLNGTILLLEKQNQTGKQLITSIVLEKPLDAQQP